MGSRISWGRGGGGVYVRKLIKGYTKLTQKALPCRDFPCRVCCTVPLPTSLFARIFIYSLNNTLISPSVRECGKFLLLDSVSWALE